ncbi:MAG: DUF1570 domain-containing protein [Planctomycetes bacterium]|nr:DUF1570 domain-containing protein [Planctomycetota bacterium]
MPGGFRARYDLAAFALLFLAVGNGCTVPPARRAGVTLTPWSEEGFVGRRLSSAHIQIYSTLADPLLEGALPGFAEAAYGRYTQTIAPRHAPSRLNFYVFNTRAEWERFTQRRYPLRSAVYARIRAGGYTEGAASATFLTGRGDLLAALAHEGWHQYVATQLDAGLPAWLNEGLACYHEAVDCAAGRPRFTPRNNTRRLNSLREAIAGDRLIPLADLLRTDAGEVLQLDHSGVTEAYYAQVWALTVFLKDAGSSSRAAALRRLLDDAAVGRLSARTRAWRLGRADAVELSFGEVVFRAYFAAAPESLADEYYDFLVRLTRL